MHILHRITVVTALGLVVLPLGASAMLSPADTNAVRSRLQESLHQAASRFNIRSGLVNINASSKKTLSENQKRILELGKKKREVRFKLARLLKTQTLVGTENQKLIQEQEQTSKNLVSERERLGEFVRLTVARQDSVESGEGIFRILGKQLFLQSMSDSLQDAMRYDALTAARQTLVLSLVQAEKTNAISGMRLKAAAGEIGDDIAETRAELETLRAQYLKSLKQSDSAWKTMTLTEAQLLQVKAETAGVRREILNLQDELARIDARTKRTAERNLIEMGLIGGKVGQHSDGKVVGVGQFAWPVYGRISAGYHNADYVHIFRVPHEGIDIPTPQGTPVRSSADGVVFIVRQGGATGYTYILIGHRNGYSTLYGHLSETSVQAGQDILQGEVIGYSGGTPGTNGAGPMTTGAHLHFEVLQGSENIDPELVLPVQGE